MIRIITWFLLGKDGYIAEFDSGGAIVPDIIAKNAADNQILVDYFDNLRPSTEAQMNPWLNKYVDPNHILEPSKYGYYAKRGLISFDKINPGPGSNGVDYHLIAHPVEGLDFHTLTDQIKEIISRNQTAYQFQRLL